jgi:hypothetical protein
MKFSFIDRIRGPDFCPYCGEELRWVRLISGMWAAVQPDPVLYIPGKGRAHLIDAKWDGEIITDCLIYRGGRGMDARKARIGYEQHMYRCCMRGKAREDEKSGITGEKAEKGGEG